MRYGKYDKRKIRYLSSFQEVRDLLKELGLKEQQSDEPFNYLWKGTMYIADYSPQNILYVCDILQSRGYIKETKIEKDCVCILIR